MLGLAVNASVCSVNGPNLLERSTVRRGSGNALGMLRVLSRSLELCTGDSTLIRGERSTGSKYLPSVKPDIFLIILGLKIIIINATPISTYWERGRCRGGGGA